MINWLIETRAQKQENPKCGEKERFFFSFCQERVGEKERLSIQEAKGNIKKRRWKI